MNHPTSNYLYSIFEENYSLGGQTHMGFGILIVSTTNNEVITKIDDITASKHELCSLVRLCNTLSLDPIHIYDVIEDFLSRK